MRESFKIQTENGKLLTVVFTIIKDTNSQKPYGIASKILETGKDDIFIASHRFFTYAEAIATVDMLCRFQVMPCTLNDII